MTETQRYNNNLNLPITFNSIENKYGKPHYVTRSQDQLDDWIKIG